MMRIALRHAIDGLQVIRGRLQEPSDDRQNAAVKALDSIIDEGERALLASASLVSSIPTGMPMSVLAWAEERYSNTFDIAASKTGTDREGWLEDARYWELIVEALRAAGHQR